MIEIYTYDEMEQKQLPMDILEEMRHFGFVRCESFDSFICISLEMLDFNNLLLSQGSLLLYLQKDTYLCFTSKKEEVTKILQYITEKYSAERFVYGLFEVLSNTDDMTFDQIEKEIMEMEEALIASAKRDFVSEIIGLRKRLMILKKYYEQMLNTLDILIENENKLFEEETIRSFRMLYRRTERHFQNILNLRESVTQIRESYEAEVDISLNKTMKIFTVVTSIFLPLTLIVGWYGMNFDMPEYEWKHGYLFVSMISVLFLISGILFFRKKRWF